MRIGVIADPHVALDRREDIVWHHRLRLEDAHERFDAALSSAALGDVDAIAVLGDLTHFGETSSLEWVIDRVAADGRPTVLLSGNHDVFEAGVRLPDLLRSRRAGTIWNPVVDVVPAQLVTLFTGERLAARAWEVVDRGSADRPFRAECRDLAPGPGPTVTFTHFPTLDIASRCGDAGLRYAGSLATLADHEPAPGRRPEVVLAGHLHLRAYTVEHDTVQLSLASLVEPPHDVATVTVDHDPASGAVRVEVHCTAVDGPPVARPPVLEPDRVAFRWSSEDRRWSRGHSGD